MTHSSPNSPFLGAFKNKYHPLPIGDKNFSNSAVGKKGGGDLWLDPPPPHPPTLRKNMGPLQLSPLKSS